jgi:hypothetical protein
LLKRCDALLFWCLGPDWFDDFADFHPVFSSGVGQLTSGYPTPYAQSVIALAPDS